MTPDRQTTAAQQHAAPAPAEYAPAQGLGSQIPRGTETLNADSEADNCLWQLKY